MTEKRRTIQTGIHTTMTQEDLEAFLRLLIYVSQDENKPLALDYVQYWLTAKADNPAKKYFDAYIKEYRPADLSEFEFYAWATSTETRLAFLEYASKEAKKDLQPKAGRTPTVAPIWENDFMPVYNGDFVRDFVELKKSDFEKIEDENGKPILTAETPKGQIQLIDSEGNSVFLESFGPLAVKLFDVGLATFTYNNHYDKGPAANVRIDVDFLKFAEDQDRDITAPTDATEEQKQLAKGRRDKFIHEINQNLTDLSNFVWPLPGGPGNQIGILQKTHYVRNNIITFYIDQGFADLMKKAGIIMQWPAALLKTDNKDPNAYKLGRMIANRHSNDRNAERGIESTLSIKSMLKHAPAIPTFEHLRSLSKQGRDWRQKIKAPLEKSFTEFKRVGFFKNWQYRDPRTGKTYTPEQATSLSLSDYETLMVDYTLENVPNQDERRARRIEERKKRQEAAEATGKTRKKPGPKPKGNSIPK